VLARKKERAETKAKREAQKTLPDLRKEAQKAFNDFIRARDADKPCICCGRWPSGAEALTGGSWDAGHFRGRGANLELSFDEDNCHKQLKGCNRGDWDRVAYEAELVRRIGPERVAILKGPHPMLKLTRDDLRAIRTKYRLKVAQSKREHDSAS
jgi:hypothetical protein